MIDYPHIGNHCVYRPIDQLPGEITIKVVGDWRQSLERLEPRIAKVRSRILVVIDSNTKDQLQYLLNKISHIIKFLGTSNIGKRIAVHIYSSLYKDIKLSNGRLAS